MRLYLLKHEILFHCGKNMLTWIGLDLEPDPELDPDPHSSKRLDLD
jgi:hypothetical protein